jgi:VWFA-related protein
MIDKKLLTRRQVLFGIASATAGGLFLRAQEGSRAKPPTFSVDVEVVNVLATVRDKKGNIVKDLVREDFTLSENGRAQNIRYFSRESDLPLTIGLLVDTTPSESSMMNVERKASLAFLDRMLRPEKDKAFLIQYYEEIELLQDLTSSREKLEAALDSLQTHSMGTRGRGSRGGGGRPGGGAALETALADAVYLASDEIMKQQPGRKALFILGDGDHVGDREEEAISAAQRADTIIYSIRIYDKNFGGNNNGRGTVIRIPGLGIPGSGRGGGPGGGPGGPGGGPGGPPNGRGGMDSERGKKNLQELSGQTGGAYFEVGKKETLEQIYGKIEEELRSQYNLGYTPDAGAQDGYRKINVSVRKKDMVVRSREGYYAKK